MTIIKRKKPLTLIETLLALAIAAILSAFVFGNGASLLNTFLEKQNIQSIERYFSLGKKLSTIYTSDVELHLKSEKGRIYLSLFSDEPAIIKLLKGYPKVQLNRLEHIYSEEDIEQELHILFTGSGWTLPKCNLKLLSRKKEYTICIDNSLQITPKRISE